MRAKNQQRDRSHGGAGNVRRWSAVASSVAAILPLLAPVNASGKPLCMRWLERDFALASRKIFDASNRKTPRDAFNVLREPFGQPDASSFVFTNRTRKGQVSHLLLVLPGSAFHPAYLLENIERAVPARTEVAVFEYPYLQPGVDPGAAFVASDEIVRRIASGLAIYRQRHGYEKVGIYASSMGASLAAGLLQSQVRIDFLVLDGVQETAPMPIVCSRRGWLKDILPPLLGALPRVILISNRNDLQERIRALRKIPSTDLFSVVELDAEHPWEDPADVEPRVATLQKIFSPLL
ncbi:hypothetical protein JM946_09685 [Steroidobacter sp. S1-65]|uniref:Alpha/beta hydrolase n=1 Tax=Steroidobacter gossypii TaxID=2805490 RepID=A0ABS1WVL6_9GAMM|nr:hypothetical protein [Steroidobacter gossypii]MBM0105021.1 hypothetical protein [Steroidobacter gossypii]